MRSHPKKRQVVQADAAPRGESSCVISNNLFMENGAEWGKMYVESNDVFKFATSALFHGAPAATCRWCQRASAQCRVQTE